VDHVEKYKLPKHLLEKEEAIRTNPGHAYEGLELASDYRLDQGQDLFARPKEEPPMEEPSKQEQKESKRKWREEKEDKRREKEERRRAREERKREKRAKVYRETSDSDEPRQKKHY
jgi:hypothetical protein